MRETMTDVGPAGTVMLLGFGEGGAYLAGALRRHSARLGVRTVLAYDATAGNPGAAGALRKLARDLGVGLVDEPGKGMAEADVVFSLVPGTVAVEVAALAGPRMKPGAAYVDLNSITAQMMRDVAAALDGARIDVVDGAVLGNFRGSEPVPVILAGAAADRAAALLPEDAFVVDVIAGPVGDASAIKMLRSVLMKGLEALCVECLVAAEVEGVRPALLRAFRDLDSRPFANTMELLTVTHLVHAARRLGEVKRVADVLAASGVEGTMTEATRRLFSATVAAAAAPEDGTPLPLDETLDVLIGILGDPARRGPATDPES